MGNDKIFKIVCDILCDLAYKKKFFSKQDFKQALEKEGFEVKSIDILMDIFKFDLKEKDGLYSLDLTNSVKKITKISR